MQDIRLKLRILRRIGRPPVGSSARQLIAIRVDPDVLERFRKEARGETTKDRYQTLINEVDRWAVEAKPIAQLQKLGWTPDTLKGGEMITVRGYRSKPGASVADTIPPPRRRALETVFELATAGRMLHGIELTLPDGKRLEL
jgi:hypothetical protein